MLNKLISDYIDNKRYKINLVASENVTSPLVTKVIGSDLNHRYCIPPKGERPEAIWDYPDQIEPRQIYKITQDLACELYNGSAADIRPLSGNQVAHIIISTLVKPGETVWSVPADCGGHFATKVICEKHNIVLRDLPYDRIKECIDLKAIMRRVNIEKPKLVFLDSSMLTHPYDVKGLRAAVGPDVIISYDASHVFGLIAGKGFQSPLNEGADLIHGSTHKSLWGPQKGIIIFKRRDTLYEKIHTAVLPEYVSNIHLHHVAALGLALQEHQKHGVSYVAAINNLILALAQGLDSVSMKPRSLGGIYSSSHQLILRIGSREEAESAFARLEKVGLNLNLIKVPFTDGYGFRIGVSEIARRGFCSEEANLIGIMIEKVIRNNCDLDSIHKQVRDLAEKNNQIFFC
ncbi:hypothetical protein LOZ86_09860 [Pectobacterium parvum]|uniref:hypothetical protein n=1 Tax=Pectobacterium parvum TaxID=2778550 RepID=UPI001E47A890|nr:hypothetical protein [Pectobacterium parvum]UFK41096.1 hypothetical protein LOZ86_09860 [Pectobacterium parvum]GKW44181.1 serine hydroxymethyltransferase [Pectobacterium carotovorum subsp. carotovorum]